MTFLAKWLTLPESNNVKEIKTIQTWRVTWYSRYGRYSTDTRQEVEIFTSEEEAMFFKNSLIQAYSLIRHTSGNSVKLERNK